MTTPDTQKSGAPKILIAEDSRTQAAHLQHILEREGYDVVAARNGEDALSMARVHRPALVVSDIVMPGMDGYELCLRIKSGANTRRTPVILLTSLSEPTDIIRGLECGADNFITKPFDEQFLLSRVDYLLAEQKVRGSGIAEMGIEIVFDGHRHFITSSRMQIMDLLLATYQTAMEKKEQLERANRELTKALETIRKLEGLIPICASCKKIRNDEGFWQQVEEYISDHSSAQFTHSLCPDCVTKLYPDYVPEEETRRRQGGAGNEE